MTSFYLFMVHYLKKKKIEMGKSSMIVHSNCQYLLPTHAHTIEKLFTLSLRTHRKISLAHRSDIIRLLAKKIAENKNKKMKLICLEFVLISLHSSRKKKKKTWHDENIEKQNLEKYINVIPWNETWPLTHRLLNEKRKKK